MSSQESNTTVTPQQEPSFSEKYPYISSAQQGLVVGGVLSIIQAKQLSGTYSISQLKLSTLGKNLALGVSIFVGLDYIVDRSVAYYKQNYKKPSSSPPSDN